MLSFSLSIDSILSNTRYECVDMEGKGRDREGGERESNFHIYFNMLVRLFKHTCK